MSEESRKAGTELRDSETTDAIIAAAIAVHRELGPGFLESIYEQALAVELKAVDALENVHFAIVRSYLKATGLADGLILNFSTMPLTVKRVRRERGFRTPELHL